MDKTLADPFVGVVLDGRYRIERRLARGGMATVYEALDERLERTVAVKVTQAGHADDPGFVERFVREARAAAALGHPNVVAVYDQGVDGGLAYLVMELVVGHTLRDELGAKGRFAVPDALAVLEPVLDALAAAHRYGMVHRDVKPENVLVGQDGQVKVADFGLSRAIEASRQSRTTGPMMGTVAYVAPEQITGDSADARSDVYAAGILLFELLTGTVPYRGPSAVSVAYQHVHQDVPAPSSLVPGIPAQVDDLVRRATRRAPGARPSDAGVFLAELRMAQVDLGLRGDSATDRVTEGATERLAVGAPGFDAVVAAPPPSARHAAPPDAVSSHRAPPDAPPEAELPLEQQRTRAVPALAGPGGRAAAPVRHRLSRRRPPTALAVLAGLVALGLVAGLVGWWAGAGRYTRAPSLIALTEAAATTKARDAGLRIVVERRANETERPGLVFGQRPSPDGRIRRNGTVTVFVSTGPPLIEVPPLAGVEKSIAQDRLTSAGLGSRATNGYSATVPRGYVVSSSPAAGTALRRGQTVTLVVSLGPRSVRLPDLRGREVDEARRVLAGLGLAARLDERDTTEDDEVGRVLGQEPGAGEVRPGTAVTLTVGRKVTEVEVPDVTGRRFSQAREILEEAGLEVRRQSFGRGSGNGRVIAQNPPAGMRVPARTEVTVYTL